MRIRGVSKVIIQGSSTVIPITKFLKGTGIVPGDSVRFSIEKVESEKEDPSIKIGSLEKVGDNVYKTIGGKGWADDKARSLIQSYGVDPSDVDLVLKYVRDKEIGKNDE